MTLTTDSRSTATFDPDDLSVQPVDRPTVRRDRRGPAVPSRRCWPAACVAAAGFLTTSVVGARRRRLRHPGHTVRRPGARCSGFRPIPPSTADEVVVPPGYTARPFIPWGTPLLGAYPAFRPGTPSAGVPTATPPPSRPSRSACTTTA